MTNEKEILEKLQKKLWALYRNEHCDCCDNSCMCNGCFDNFIEEAFNKGAEQERKRIFEAVEKANNKIHAGKGIVLTQEDWDLIKK